MSHWREAIEYSEPQIHVALDGDTVVGFVGFDRSRDKGTPPTMGEIWSIYAAPDQWSRGVGLALWDAAREGLEEEGCTQVSIWLPLRNERALRFLRTQSSLKVEDSGPLFEHLLSTWQGHNDSRDADLAALQFSAGGQR